MNSKSAQDFALTDINLDPTPIMSLTSTGRLLIRPSTLSSSRGNSSQNYPAKTYHFFLKYLSNDQYGQHEVEYMV